MKTDFCKNKMEKLLLNYDFLKPFDQEITKKLIDSLETEIKYLDKTAVDLKKTKNSYDSEKKLKPEVKEYIVYLNDCKKILREYLFCVKKLYIFNSKTIETDQEQSFELTTKQEMLLNHLLTNGLTDNIKIKDLTDIYLFLLKKHLHLPLLKQISLKLVEMANQTKDEDLKEYLTILINRLKQQTNKQIKIDSNSTELRSIRDSFNSVLNKPTVLKHDYKFDIIDFWLNKYDSYIYIKRLTDLLPEVVNLKDDNKQSIIFTILEYYFTSCRIELRSQTKNFIPKEYYAKIFNLFYNHPQFIFDEKELLEQKIEDFKEQIKKYKLAPTIVKCLLELGKQEEKQEESLENVECDYLRYVYQSAIKKPNRVNISNEDTFTIVNSNYPYINRCYSVKMNEKGRHVISVHTIDMSEYIDADSSLDKYLKQKMFKNGETILPEDLIINYLSLEKNVLRPTITYEVELLGNGRIASYDIYKSVVKVNHVFDYDNFVFPNELVKSSYYNLLNDFNLDKNDVSKNIEQMFLAKVSRVVGSYFTKRKLPCVYRVQLQQDSKNFVDNMNGLNGFMSKISKPEAKVIYQVICEDHNTAFYNNENIKHASFEQPYYLDLFNPLDNYITITLQRLINDFYINADHYNVDLWQQELVDIINRANTCKGLVKQAKTKSLGSI